MVETSGKFAILVKSTTLRELSKDKKNSTGTKVHKKPGTLLRLSKYTSNQFAKQHGHFQCQVQLVTSGGEQNCDALYICPVASIGKVCQSLWPFMLSIPTDERRIRFFEDPKRWQWVMGLKEKDIVNVLGGLVDGPKDARYDCIIRFIGLVEEFAALGFVFGLEILTNRAGHSPQTEQIPYAIKYFTGDPNWSIFAAADALTPLTADEKKKFSASELFTNVLGKVIGPGYCLSDDRDRHSKEPTARFYDNPPPAVQPATEPLSNATPPSPTDSDGFYDMGNEDFKERVNNYEAKLQTRSKALPLAGILKTDKEHSNKTPSTAILDMGDRDLLIIDAEDVEKAQPVIVLEHPPQKDKDLAEVLGVTNWPDMAGYIGNNKVRNNTAPPKAREPKEHAERSYKPSSKGTLTKKEKADKKREFGMSANESASVKQDNAFNEALSFKDQVPIPTLDEVPETNLGVGSLVEVSLPEMPDCLYGVIRWVNVPPGESSLMVGVELEEVPTDTRLNATDGSFKGMQLFRCNGNRAIFVHPDRCMKDRRFEDSEGAGGVGGEKASTSMQRDSKMFGQVECPTVPGTVAPRKVNNLEELEKLCGKFKGIQGHHNSCYLDATLFAMFTFTSVFDSVLFRPATTQDIPSYTEVQKVLREEIVNPLRKNNFVRADRVLKLRQFMDRLSSVSGLMSEEKDPEEFLNSLLAQIMHAEPFLKLSSGQDSYFYQLFVEKDERLLFPSVQQLFEQSFHSSDIKLKEVPSCLIIQMPRFGKDFKMYPRILPSQVLDITDIIDDAPRQCSVCGSLAEFECRECFGVLQSGMGLEGTAFCSDCLEKVHMHEKRANHTFKKLTVPEDFRHMSMSVPRVYMELFAVVCIETSHYVSFVKAGSGPDAPWCFFDSMADRKGEVNGYNIPEMITVPELPHWLSEQGSRELNESSSNDKLLSEHAKRLFCDAYMCMYQSSDVMMYR